MRRRKEEEEEEELHAFGRRGRKPHVLLSDLRIFLFFLALKICSSTVIIEFSSVN